MISFAQNDNGKLWISAQGGLMFSNVYSARGHNYNKEYDEYAGLRTVNILGWFF